MTILDKPYQRYLVYAGAGIFNVGLFYLADAVHVQTDKLLNKAEREIDRKVR